MSTPVLNILKEFELRKTPSRSAIVELFLSSDFALSHADIEKAIDTSIDRVTVYRTLKSFLDKGLIHKVLDDSGVLKYALCTHQCSSNDHHHDHVHFKCTKCGQTNCIDDVNIPVVQLPTGYKIEDVSLLIQGICEKCSG